VAATFSQSSVVDRLMSGIDVVFHQAAIRITQCAEKPRFAARGPGGRGVQRARSGGARRSPEGGGGVSASVMAPPRRFRRPKVTPAWQPHDHEREPFNEGLRSFSSGPTRRCVLQRLRPAWTSLARTEVFIRWMDAMPPAGRP
jgi:UDP-glucose 4-epimerase